MVAAVFKPRSWGKYPIFSGRSILPEVGEYCPSISFSSVDLPEPLSPISPVKDAEKVPESSRRHAVPSGQEKEILLKVTWEKEWLRKVDMKATPLCSRNLISAEGQAHMRALQQWLCGTACNLHV